MKNSAIHIFLSLFLSILVIYGGSGVNVVLISCTDCKGKATVLERLIGKQCCCTLQALADCDHTDCCSVTRIDFDWQPTSGNYTHFQPLSIDLHYAASLSANDTGSAIYASSLCRLFNRKSQSPPYLSKDDYFDLLNMLII